MARVLVVDDDPRFVRAIVRLLRGRKYEVESVLDGESALRALRRGNFDIALLDVNLPDIDGLSLLHQLRDEGNHTPVILLTVHGRAHEQALGLRLGGDDYIPKPFDAEVLVARVQAVLRRTAVGGPSSGPAERPPATREDVLELPTVRIDLTARQVFKDGVAVRLAPMEYAVLEFLAVNRGRAVAKEEIMLHVWGIERRASRTLAEHISRLRRKLGDDVIITQTGFGYLIPAAPTSLDSVTTTP
ncbi:response regulator transcription factor [Actinomadura sp. SCN-SB]|uniref:response regulator transcription factor n=1 Tax=Actinomadura sp. SCN-SB TaxID=3373092 RepID=UPI003753266C